VIASMYPSSLQSAASQEDLRVLREVVASFNGAASKFELSYLLLEEKVKELDLELKDKNEELNANLREKEEIKNYLHNILESLGTGVVVIDLAGRITTLNQAVEEIIGVREGEAKGRGIEEILAPEVFPNPLLRGEALRAVQEPMEIEAEFYPAGRGALHLGISISPLKNSEGRRMGTVLALQDITQMKRLEEQANRTDRLAAMGEMAVKIAHEVRNPLGSIELLASLLRKELEGSGELRDLAEHISSGVKSINAIISNMLLFMRPQQKPNLQVIEIHSPLQDSLFFCRHLMKAGDSVQVHTRYTPGTLRVKGDLELLKQMALNIILNAMQAMPQGGALTISTARAKALGSGQEVVEIRFADTGAGICRSARARVFDPFFTTKERGTGLGLAIVHNIVEIHGGTVALDSPGPHQGTTCLVTLPLCEEKSTCRRSRATRSASRHAHQGVTRNGEQVHISG
jgi:PAS domain S-box-containing protein